MTEHLDARENARSRLSKLSRREAEILALSSSGMTNRQIALRLSLSVHAVKFHLAAVYRKLDVANRTEAAGAYFRGLAEQPIGQGAP